MRRASGPVLMLRAGFIYDRRVIFGEIMNPESVSVDLFGVTEYIFNRARPSDN